MFSALSAPAGGCRGPLLRLLPDMALRLGDLPAPVSDTLPCGIGLFAGAYRVALGLHRGFRLCSICCSSSPVSISR